MIFLSTLSLRRATRRSVKLFRQNYISIHALLAESDAAFCQAVPSKLYFYPRSPCGERPVKGKPASPVIGISIHALLAESDDFKSCKGISYFIFLSTLSLRRATWLQIFLYYQDNNFYPRSPCGERPALLPTDGLFFLFLSTLSLRRAT